MRHVFRCEETKHKYTEITSDAVALPEILLDFERYLRACGYITFGQLEIVEEEEE